MYRLASPTILVVVDTWHDRVRPSQLKNNNNKPNLQNRSAPKLFPFLFFHPKSILAPATTLSSDDPLSDAPSSDDPLNGEDLFLRRPSQCDRIPLPHPSTSISSSQRRRLSQRKRLGFHFISLILLLLQKWSITAVGKREKLLRMIKNPITQYLPPNTRKIGFSYSSEKLVKIRNYVDTVESDTDLVFVVGAMAHGKIDTDYTDDYISVSSYPLSAAFYITSICKLSKDYNVIPIFQI